MAGKLEWSEVEDVAQTAFRIWVDGSELAWARQAWEALVAAGLTDYTNDRDRARVAVRFFALAGLYHDFCCVAWEECVEPDYEEWAAELGVSPFHIGQLAGTAGNYEDEKEALQQLAEMARDEVVPVLLNRFGGVSELFVELWRTSQGDADDEAGEDEFTETDDDILNYVTPGKGAAFMWIDQGCQALSYDLSDEVVAPAVAAPTPHPLMLLVAQEDGTLKPEFEDWETNLSLSRGDLIPLEWPYVVEGRQLTVEERARSFEGNLEAMLHLELPLDRADAAAKVSDLVRQDPTLPRRVLLAVIGLKHMTF